VTRAPTEFFFLLYLFFSRHACLGLIMKDHIKSVTLRWWIDLDSNFSVLNNIKLTLHYAHIRWASAHTGWSRTCSIGFIFSYKIIVGVTYIIVLSLMAIYGTGETKVRTDCLKFGVSLCIQIKNEALGLCFSRILDPVAVPDCTKFSSWIMYSYNDWVSDIIQWEISSTECVTNIMNQVLSNKKVLIC